MLKNITVQVMLAAAFAIVLAIMIGDPNWVETPNAFYNLIQMLKGAFLAILRMLIAPMIFFSLIAGIASIGNVIRLRALGGVTVIYYLSTTLMAIILALIAVLFIHPWTDYPPLFDTAVAAGNTRLLDPSSGSVTGVLDQMFRLAFTNPFAALAEMNILGIVTNALLIGIATVLALPAESPVFAVINDVNKVISTVLGWVIRLIPIGVFAIIFDFTIKLSVEGGYGEAVLTQLLEFGTLVVGLTLIHGLVVLPLIAWFVAKKSPLSLFRDISQPLLVAFSTSSSAATLPVTMRTANNSLGVDESVSSFVLPLGATMNMDGTALFEAVAAVFLAYLFGVELTGVAIFTIFIMAMMASIGAPGMPSASMAGMQMVLIAVGIPLEAIAILLVIERPLDTIRTAVNVEGDLIGSLVVHRFFKGEPATA